ncbi:Aste57867_3239 [Aphanomyces stellatus]|uniref:Aste57867_3239 protein n=1 Tax=Aphanomyces stellatus TaxID=120398 RepID=A0A485KDL2_9STRA|nr:hypothetical protein As57867_003229 [Aphanomyces stellatus]VFT80412.1 Aste57867_3239 [Aphanomyces stellatus]
MAFCRPIKTSFGDFLVKMAFVASLSDAWPLSGGGLALGLVSLAAVAGLQFLVFIPLRSPLSRVPGPPPSSFIFGHVLDILARVDGWSLVGDFPEPHMSYLKQFGRAVHLRMFTTETVHFTDPKAVQHILTSSLYERDSVGQVLAQEMTLGVGLLSAEGAAHDTQRKTLNPHFGIDHVKDSLNIVGAVASRCSKTILANAASTNTPLDLALVLKQVMLSAVGLTTLEYDFSINPAALEAYQNFQLNVSNPIILMGVTTIPWFTSLPLPSFQRRRRARTALREIITDVIQTKLNTQTHRSLDLLDRMLNANMDSQEAIVHVMTFMFAGHETTSAALSWAFTELGAHPDVAKRVRDEACAALATHGALDNWDALEDLPFTKAVIQETLRLHPILPFLMPRVATVDSVIPMSDGSSVSVPKGTNVVVVAAVMHRDPAFWSQPEAFLPERFVKGSPLYEEDFKRRWGKSYVLHYLPFGGGVKNCIGQRFAMAELQLVLATFVAQFDFRLTAGANCHAKYNVLTTAPTQLEMTVQPWSK